MNAARRAEVDPPSEESTGSTSTTASTTAEVDVRDYVPAEGGTITNLACGLVVLALGVFALITALELDLGTVTMPRAGMWPAVLSTALIVLGALIALAATTFRDAERLTVDSLGVLYGAVSLVVAVYLMPLIGFEIAAFVLLVYWMTVLGKEPLKLSIPIAVVSVIAFYLIFITGLRVPLPRLF